MQGFNKYYPPDYDPEKHSSLNAYRGKHALGDRARKIDQGILITRFELPYNIWCGGCNNHIGMGVRYNAEKKKIGNYYSTPIFEFRCKCHLCDNWFTIETDPKNTRYVVTSGARQKDEEWDPEENGGFAIHDPSKSAPLDPLAQLEKTTAAQTQATSVTAPRLESLQSLSDKYNTDPFTLSSRVRKQFRVEKKVEKRKREADDALRDKYALPEDLLLLRDEDEGAAREEAKRAFEEGRRESRAEDEAKRRRIAAELGRPPPAPSLPVKKPPSRASASSTRPPSAVTTLRNRLLQNTARQTDPFLRQSNAKPPDKKSLGVSIRK